MPRRLFLFLFLALWMPCAAVSAELYQPEFAPQPGTYHYSIRWGRFTIAKADVTVSRKGPFYLMEVNANTSGIVDRFYTLRYKGQGKITASDLTPVQMHMEQQENSIFKTLTITFHAGGEVEAVEIKYKEEEEPEKKVKKVQSNGQVLDPFSAAFLARGIEWSKGEVQKYEIITGKHVYLVTLTCVDKERIKIMGKKREAWVISPKIKKISEPEKKKKKKIKWAKIYVSADDRREVLQLKSKATVGSVRAKLERFEPLVPPEVPRILSLKYIAS